MPPIASPAFPIDDDVLAQMVDVARDARHGRADVADALVLVEMTPALLSELLIYRRCLGAQFGDDPTNVVRMPRKARLRCVAGPELGGAA